VAAPTRRFCRTVLLHEGQTDDNRRLACGFVVGDTGFEFHAIEKADAEGRYRLTGLVPGTLMLGADGWPGRYAPRCWSGFQLTESTKRSLPLVQGAVVRGRLVYAETGTPVITNVAFELVENRPGATSPTDEHPSRDRAARTGVFEIPRLGSATMTGRLAQLADTDQITSPRFLVTYPFQDGTPYWLASAESEIDVVAGAQIDLGDVPLVLHPTAADR
jgi:hypothetical protein